jgi:hypothetical protein
MASEMNISIPDLLVPRSVLKIMEKRDLVYFNMLCLLNMPSTEYIKHTFESEQEKEYVLSNIDKTDVRSIGPGDPGNPLSINIILKSRPVFEDQKLQNEVSNWYCKMFSDIYSCEAENRKQTDEDKREAIFKRNNIFPGMIQYFTELGYQAWIDEEQTISIII